MLGGQWSAVEGLGAGKPVQKINDLDIIFMVKFVYL